MNKLTLHNNADEFFLEGCPKSMLLSRGAAKDVIRALAERGFQLYGMDGGIFRENGTFEQRIDSAWSRSKKARTKEEAEYINKYAVSSIDEDPEYYNAYALMVFKFK